MIPGRLLGARVPDMRLERATRLFSCFLVLVPWIELTSSYQLSKSSTTELHPQLPGSIRAEEMAWWVECLLCKHQDLGSSSLYQCSFRHGSSCLESKSWGKETGRSGV